MVAASDETPWRSEGPERCLCNCSYYPLRPVKSQALCLRGICSAASWTGAVQPGEQQQHRFFSVFTFVDQLYPAQEVPGLGEALARDRGNGVCIPIGPSLVGTFWFHVAATSNIM